MKAILQIGNSGTDQGRRIRIVVSIVGLCAVLGSLATLVGCKLGPDYSRPSPLGQAAVPAAFGDQVVTNAGHWKTAEPSANLPRGEWWTIYGDNELSRLEWQASTNNQQIAAALANFEQARAAVGLARADFFPQVNLTPSASRLRTSAKAQPTGPSAGKSVTYNSFNLPADAAWELDLWGGIHRQVEGARAAVTATVDEAESVRLSVHAAVAIDYFMIRTLEAQYALLKETADAYQKAFELVASRRRAGVATDLEVLQAETQLKSALSELPAVNLQLAQTRHALAVLCGLPSTTFGIAPGVSLATNLPSIPVSVPSEWLESRPDIAAAERRMAAANAGIGVANAAFYPRLTLGGTAGFESIGAGDILSWPSRLWAIGPSLRLPVFTGGRNQAQLSSARAAYDGAVAQYRQTVLSGFQEVEDQLAAQRLLAEQLEVERDALMSAQRTLAISNARYQAGAEQYLDVIIAQTVELAHRQNLVRLTGQKLAASVSLIKAQGGGGKLATIPDRQAGVTK